MSIPIPDATPARARRSPWRDEDPDFITINEAETLAQQTGQYRGMTVEFSDDGLTWTDAWVPASETAKHPTHARATVKRKTEDGDLTATAVVLRWEEFVPALDDENRPFWDEKPTVMLGKCAKVSAYRGGFHDVIGNRYERAEFHRKHSPLAISA